MPYDMKPELQMLLQSRQNKPKPMGNDRMPMRYDSQPVERYAKPLPLPPEMAQKPMPMDRERPVIRPPAQAMQRPMLRPEMEAMIRRRRMRGGGP